MANCCDLDCLLNWSRMHSWQEDQFGSAQTTAYTKIPSPAGPTVHPIHQATSNFANCTLRRPLTRGNSSKITVFSTFSSNGPASLPCSLLPKTIQHPPLVLYPLFSHQPLLLHRPASPPSIPDSTLTAPSYPSTDPTITTAAMYR